MREVWVDEDSHTLPMVCFGVKDDHLVLTPLNAKEIGEKFLEASERAFAVIQSRVDRALLDKERANAGKR